MNATRLITGLVLAGALAATPAFAQDGRRRQGDRQGQRTEQNERRGGRATGRRAVPRESARPSEAPRQSDSRRDDRSNVAPADQARRGNDARRSDDNRRYDDGRRYSDGPRYSDNRRYDDGRRGAGRTYYPYYSNRGYGSRTIIVPRVVRPSIVTVVPYRPYRYRPSIGIGIYYGSGGLYPYGYTPRGYFDPIPGRPYGGLRITGFSRDAQVFADGYYVGIVDDFDGIFQHVNLEAGPHQIEIVEPGFEGVSFDVLIQAGRTTTFRADRYGYGY